MPATVEARLFSALVVGGAVAADDDNDDGRDAADYLPPPTRRYSVWSSAEVDALRQGVQAHGLGAWEAIRRDPLHEAVLRSLRERVLTCCVLECK